MTSEGTATFSEAAVEAVREASRQGRLASLEDLLAALEADGAFLVPVGLEPEELAAPTQNRAKNMAPDMAAGRAVLLAAALAEAPDVASFQSVSGATLYHAPDLLSHTFAGILDRKGSPLLLMAEEIRINSRDYPRPVPVELFEAPPFDLTPEEIEHALRAMASDPRYQDITFTPAPTGAVYLFSTLHLERGYAQFLAQRAESLAMNP